MAHRMRFARTFMAVVIALSVALLPTAGSAAQVFKSAEAAAAAEMAAAMDDCAAHHADMHHAGANHAKPCGQDADQCRFMASCAHLNFSMANIAAAPFVYPVLAAARLPALTDHAVPLRGANPPFRPPRV